MTLEERKCVLCDLHDLTWVEAVRSTVWEQPLCRRNGSEQIIHAPDCVVPELLARQSDAPN